MTQKRSGGHYPYVKPTIVSYLRLVKTSFDKYFKFREDTDVGGRSDPVTMVTDVDTVKSYQWIFRNVSTAQDIAVS